MQTRAARNETHLAVELDRAKKRPMSPFAVACDAAELCRLGRRYIALSEDLANTPDEGERVGKRRRKVGERIEAILKAYRAEGAYEGDGIHWVVITKGSRGFRAETVLR